MQIRFHVEGYSPLSLAGTGREAESGFRLSFADQLQVQTYLRGAKAKTVNRGSRLYSASWSTARAHETEAAADAYLLSHAAQIPPAKTGTLVFTGGAAGGATSTTTLIDASVSITDSRRLGVTTFHSYSAQGSAA